MSNSNINFNNNWEEVRDFDSLKNVIKENFNILAEDGYLYKGDMGETPQIVHRALYTDWDGKIENMPTWSELGLRLIDALFKDDTEGLGPDEKTDHAKYMKEDGTLNLSLLWEEGKLLCLTEAKEYAWWCADGDELYPIYPATFFVYLDTTKKEKRDPEWKDDSCILVPGAIEYIDADSDETNKDPKVTYSKSLVYPTFWWNADWGSRGAWCWEINGVKYNVPASVANDDGSTLGRMFIFETADGDSKYKYKYKNDWKTRGEILNDGGRVPITGDIGFCINGAGTPDTPNSLQIFTFDDEENEWFLGGSLVEFGEFGGDFYRMLWGFISEESKITIDQGKIILASNTIKHCIFISKQSEDKELCIRPFSSEASLDADADYTNVEDAKIKIGYPSIELEGNVQVTGGGQSSSGGKLTAGDISADVAHVGSFDCSDTATARNIMGTTLSADNIKASAGFSAYGNVEIDVNSLSISSSKLKYTESTGNGKDGLFKVDTPIEVTKDIVVKGLSSKSPLNPVDKVIVHSSIGVDDAANKLGTASSSVVNAQPVNIGKINWAPISTEGYTDGNGIKGPQTVSVKLKSDVYRDFGKYTSFRISEPNGIGVVLLIRGENDYGSSPDFISGSMKINMVIEYNNGNTSKTMEGADISLPFNSISYDVKPETKYVTIYGAVSDAQLASWNEEITKSQQIISDIYFTVEVSCTIETHSGTWGRRKTLYIAKYDSIVSGVSSTTGTVAISNYRPSSSGNMFVINASGSNTISNNDPVARVCNDGIVIGSASNNAIKIKFSDTNISITYATGTKSYNILTMTPSKNITSDVFAIKQQ